MAGMWTILEQRPIKAVQVSNSLSSCSIGFGVIILDNTDRVKANWRNPALGQTKLFTDDWESGGGVLSRPTSRKRDPRCPLPYH